jgi:hypothetical protein
MGCWLSTCLWTTLQHLASVLRRTRCRLLHRQQLQALPPPRPMVDVQTWAARTTCQARLALVLLMPDRAAGAAAKAVAMMQRCESLCP